jgi:hypothetical protein
LENAPKCRVTIHHTVVMKLHSDPQVIQRRMRCIAATIYVPSTLQMHPKGCIFLHRFVVELALSTPFGINKVCTLLLYPNKLFHIRLFRSSTPPDCPGLRYLDHLVRMRFINIPNLSERCESWALRDRFTLDRKVSQETRCIFHRFSGLS